MKQLTSSLSKDVKIMIAILLSSFVLSLAYIVYADDVTTDVIVGNADPVVSAPTLNSGSAITLTENTTTTVVATATVTDSNGCETITTGGSVVADFYRADVTAASCDTVGEADDDSCYPAVTCTVSGASCSGGGDTTVDYTCSVDLEYYADPTDSGTHAATDWEVTFTATDASAGSATSSANVELNSLLALDVTSAIDYGTLAANSDTAAVNQTTTVTNTGNVIMDPEVSGTDMTDASTPIGVANQEYSLTSFTYGSGTDLSASTTTVDMTLPEPEDGNVVVSDDLLWGLAVPAGTVPGTYTGTNTFTAVAGS